MRSKTSLITYGRQHWAVLFFLLEAVFFSVAAPGFLTLNGVQITLFYSTTLALLATAETFVIVTGGIDLSVGFVMGFSSVVSAQLAVGFAALGWAPGAAIVAAVLITLLIGLAPGLVNGLLISRLSVPPFLATFAVQGITFGVSLLLTAGSAAVNVPDIANVIGNGYLFYWGGGDLSFLSKPAALGARVVGLVPTMVVVTFLVIAVAAFVLKRTKFGQHTYAIGGNIDAAQRSGIPTGRHLIIVYVLSSFLASLAGVIYMLEYVTGKSDAGSSFLLDSIVAVVIGGASLFGGSGTIGKTVLGVLILSVLEMGLKIMGVQTFDKYIAVGLILIFAVLVDQYSPEPVHKED